MNRDETFISELRRAVLADVKTLEDLDALGLDPEHKDDICTIMESKFEALAEMEKGPPGDCY